MISNFNVIVQNNIIAHFCELRKRQNDKPIICITF